MGGRSRARRLRSWSNCLEVMGYMITTVRHDVQCDPHQRTGRHRLYEREPTGRTAPRTLNSYHASWITCDGLTSIEKSRLTDFIGALPPDKVRDLTGAL